jgi:hypothetical protein
MKYTYEQAVDDFGNKSIKRIEENGSVAWIPMDEGNSDYQAYLKSLDEA